MDESSAIKVDDTYYSIDKQSKDTKTIIDESKGLSDNMEYDYTEKVVRTIIKGQIEK